MQEVIALSRNTYKKAIEEASLRHIGKAFSLYVDAFLPRLHSSLCFEREFKCFYRWQLARYLYRKKNYIVALPEGDMISDLILDAYEDFLQEIDMSRFKITPEGRVNLLSSIDIVFPNDDCNDTAN